MYVEQDGIAAEILLESAEEFGRVVSSTLIKNASNINSNHNMPNIEKDNIG